MSARTAARRPLSWWAQVLTGLAVTIAVVVLMAAVWVGNTTLTLKAAEVFAYAFPAYLLVLAVRAGVQAASAAARRRGWRR